MSIYTPFGSAFDPKYLATYTGDHAPEDQKDTSAGMLPVDRDTAKIFFQGFKELGIMPRSIKGIGLDAMAGPSRFSSMMSSIYLAEGSLIHCLDFSDHNIIYQGYCAGNGVHSFEYEDVYGQNLQASTHAPLWIEVFDPEIAKLGQEVYEGVEGIDPALFTGTFKRSLGMTKTVFGDVSVELEDEREQFVIGTMFYGAESATDKLDQMGYMLNRFFYSLKVGAPFVVVLSLESEGYPAGPHTWFPATYLQKDQVLPLIRKFGWPISGKLYTTAHSYREGHDGVGVLIGRRQLTVSR